MTCLLKVDNISIKFGGLVAVDDVSFTVNEGEILGLIGPNGAGKTTLLSILSGFLKPIGGTISFCECDILGEPCNLIARKGLVRTFQTVKPLENLSVLHNVLVGAYAHLTIFQRKEAHERAHAALKLTGLTPYTNRLAGQLTLPSRKRLEIARALALRPRVVLLDEVIAGLNPTETEEAIRLIRQIRDSGVTIIMVEHVMKAIMALSDRIIVLHHGQKIAEGTPEQIINNPAAIKAYLGDSYATI